MIDLKKIKPLKWTSHAKMKMNFYRLSEGRVRRVLHSPMRIEEGIAEDTIAMMQPVSLTKRRVSSASVKPRPEANSSS